MFCFITKAPFTSMFFDKNKLISDAEKLQQRLNKICEHVQGVRSLLRTLSNIYDGAFLRN